jgi:hypothetical protein
MASAQRRPREASVARSSAREPNHQRMRSMARSGIIASVSAQKPTNQDRRLRFFGKLGRLIGSAARDICVMLRVPVNRVRCLLRLRR